MRRAILGITLAVVPAVVCASRLFAPDRPFAIVVGEGSERVDIVTEADLIEFNWPLQTMRVRDEVLSRIPLKGVLDSPFKLLVHDKVVYSGRFVSDASSKTYNEPTIHIDAAQPGEGAPGLGFLTLPRVKGTILLTIHPVKYPNAMPAGTRDARIDERIAGVLAVLGRLRMDRPTDPPDFAKWTKILNDCKAVRVGMTRDDLEKLFKLDGAVHMANYSRTYLHPLCPFVKIDVDFRRPDSPRQQPYYIQGDDKIEKVSAPYLNWPALD